jgi:hypothetical protein
MWPRLRRILRQFEVAAFGWRRLCGSVGRREWMEFRCRQGAEGERGHHTIAVFALHMSVDRGLGKRTAIERRWCRCMMGFH